MQLREWHLCPKMQYLCGVQNLERSSVNAVVRALNDAGVRYLIVGGAAVVAHGYVRFTADLDFVLFLSEDNLRRAMAALSRLEYRPRAPVALEDFVSAENRALWIRDKGLTVLSLFSPKHPLTEVDVFVEHPFDFDASYQRRLELEVTPGVLATFAGLEDLIRMKEAVGRPEDLADVRRLRALHEDPSDD